MLGLDGPATALSAQALAPAAGAGVRGVVVPNAWKGDRVSVGKGVGPFEIAISDAA